MDSISSFFTLVLSLCYLVVEYSVNDGHLRYKKSQLLITYISALISEENVVLNQDVNLWKLMGDFDLHGITVNTL